jgi:diguanylate cyclase (GGDEF)-like protein
MLAARGRRFAVEDKDMGAERAEARTGDVLVGTLAPAGLLRAELERCADVDPLLDILNRRGFERALARSLAYVKRYGTQAALVYLDLDGFKAVNDQHGHAAGDALLQAVARELTVRVRASDVVGRLGGDEFGVLMWNVSGAQAAVRARDLENRVERLSLAQGPARLGVGASAGVVPLEFALDPAAMIAAADRAMYARKKERRG